MFLSGTLQNGHVSRTARVPSDPSNTPTLRGRNPFPMLACCLLEYAMKEPPAMAAEASSPIGTAMPTDENVLAR